MGNQQSDNNDAIDAISSFGGMSYSLRDEPRIKQEIRNKNYDMDYTSQYADIVCRTNAQNLEFLKQQFPPNEVPNFDNPNCHNPTSYGNVAYIAVHAPEPYNEIATKQYNQLIKANGHF